MSLKVYFEIETYITYVHCTSFIHPIQYKTNTLELAGSQKCVSIQIKVSAAGVEKKRTARGKK